MRKIAVFHFNPLELFPPVMNLLNYLDGHLPENFRVRVFTTASGKLPSFSTPGDKIRIYRYGRYTFGLSAVSRFFQYLRFHVSSFWNNIFWRPEKMLYYETLSAGIPWLLRRYFIRHAEILIHYHEYMTESEYNQMIINRVLHRIEKANYTRSAWISHTNPDRMNMFLKDIGSPGLSHTHILPNYPPESWKSEARKKDPASPLRLVYLGSLSSLEGLYLQELCEWIRSKQGKITLDLYSISPSAQVRAYLDQQNPEWIQWRGALAYAGLPGILKQYDIGLILYRGGNLNTVFSASNKLFEYLACGLDVWYPRELEGSHGYDSGTHWPKVLRLDFTQLGSLDMEELIRRPPGWEREIPFFHDRQIQEMFNTLIH
jgi:hypothetical protein